MAQSPLRLRQYFFTKIICEAGLNFKKPLKKADTKLETKVQCNTTPHKENDRDWRIILDIQASSPDQSVSYELELRVVGFFEIAPEYPEDKISELVRITGSSILYSGAREFVLGLTSRGPWPPVLLPTISFIEPNQQKQKESPDKKSKIPRATTPRKNQNRKG